MLVEAEEEEGEYGTVSALKGSEADTNRRCVHVSVLRCVAAEASLRSIVHYLGAVREGRRCAHSPKEEHTFDRTQCHRPNEYRPAHIPDATHDHTCIIQPTRTHAVPYIDVSLASSRLQLSA